MLRLENVSVEQLQVWMAEPIQFQPSEYDEWKARQTQRPVEPRRSIRGSDFREYWVCPRRLYWNTHKPIQIRTRVSRSIFMAIRKHEVIQEHLTDLGWQVELYKDGVLRVEPFQWPAYELPASAHLDALSPSGAWMLEIKHNEPSRGDELQTSFYHWFTDARVCFVYRGGIIIPAMKRLEALFNVYKPRVGGAIYYDVLPPVHPDFPYCYSRCDYADRCNRIKSISREREEPSPEWVDWLTQIGATAPTPQIKLS